MQRWGEAKTTACLFSLGGSTDSTEHWKPLSNIEAQCLGSPAQSAGLSHSEQRKFSVDGGGADILTPRPKRGFFDPNWTLALPNAG